MNTLSLFGRRHCIGKWTRLFMTLIVLGGTFTKSSAQPPVTSFLQAINSDNVVTGGVTDIHTVNCDMLDVGAYFSNATGNDKLWTIAYGQEKGSLSFPLTSGLYVGVENGTTSYNPLSIPLPYNGFPWSPTQAFDPDVVVGNWSDVNGTHYFVAAVYQDGIDDIYMDAYELDFSTYPNITTNIIVVNKLLGSGGWHPHIDLCADPSGYVGGTYTPMMHRFAVAWSGTYEVWVASDDMATFNSGTTVIPDPAIPNHGLWSDIACVTDPVNGKEMAYLIYNDGWGPKTNYITEWDLNMKVTGPTYTGVISIPYSFHHPRIDAATLYDYHDNDGGTLFYAVDFAEQSIYGASAYRIWHATYGNYGSTCGTGQFTATFDDFNPLSGYAMCVPCPTPIWWENYDPVVCGTGDFLGGGEFPSKENFTYGFYGYGTHHVGGTPVSHDDYFVGAVDNHYCAGWGSGIPPGQVVQEVNNTPLATSFNSGTWNFQGCSMGVATCTNSGYDVLAAWYTGDPAVYGGEIRYKFGGTNYAFKLPASVTKIDAGTMEIYPNPAENFVVIKNNSKDFTISSVNVYDITGRIVFTQQASDVQSASIRLDIGSLSPGSYVIIAEDSNNGTQRARFNKK